MNKITNLILTSLLVISLGITSCNKDTANGSEISLKINILFGNQPIVYNQAYDYKSMKLKFENLRFYVCDFKFYAGNDIWAFPDKYFIFDVETLSHVITSLPKGNFTKMSFGIGVDSRRNTQSGEDAIPAVDYPMDHALNAINDMYWGWNPGYIFSKYDGRLDVNSNGVYGDSVDVNFSFHTGVNSLFRTITRNINLNSDGNPIKLNIDFEITKVFDAIDLPNEPFSHPGSDNSPEYKIAKNMVNAYGIAFSEVK